MEDLGRIYRLRKVIPDPEMYSSRWFCPPTYWTLSLIIPDKYRPSYLLISKLGHCKLPSLCAQIVGEEGLYSVWRDDFTLSVKNWRFYYSFWTFQTYLIFICRSRHNNVWNIWRNTKDNIVSWTMKLNRKSVTAVVTDRKASNTNNASVRGWRSTGAVFQAALTTLIMKFNP